MTTQNLTKNISDFLHNDTKKHGKDRHGNQRYKCLKCGTTWTDRRRDNRVDKSMFAYTRDMMIDWIDGHSFRTLARNYKLSPYYVHMLLNTMAETLPKYQDLIKNHEDCELIEYVGIDGGYLNTSNGKVCFLIAVDMDTNTLIQFMKGEENYKDVLMFISFLLDKYPNIKGITTDMHKSYKTAIEYKLQTKGVIFTHNICRVHIFMSFKSIRHHLALQMKHRIYKKDPVKLDW